MGDSCLSGWIRVVWGGVFHPWTSSPWLVIQGTGLGTRDMVLSRIDDSEEEEKKQEEEEGQL